MTRKLRLNNKNFAYYFILLLFLFFLCRNLIHFISMVIVGTDSSLAGIFNKGLYFGDFAMRWKECGYVLHGINPFDNMAGKAFLPQYGDISSLGGMVPWEYLLGNFFNPGFLPYTAAKVWFLALNLGIILYAGFCGYRLLRKNGMEQKWAAMAFPLIILPNYWVHGIIWGNQGSSLACLIFILVCIVDEHPYFAGLLLSFAMMKPQIGALFFIVLLLTRKYKTILTAGILICVSWGAAAVLTATPPFVMITQMLDLGLGLNNVVYGLFDFVRQFSLPSSAALALSMGSGIVFTLGLTLKLLKTPNAKGNNLLLYTPAAVASTFWFYKQPHDLVILIIPVCLCYLAFYKSDRKWIDYLVFGGTSLLLCGNLWKGAAKKLCSLVFPQEGFLLPYINLTDILWLIAATIVIIIYVKKQQTGLWHQPDASLSEKS